MPTSNTACASWRRRPSSTSSPPRTETSSRSCATPRTSCCCGWRCARSSPQGGEGAEAFKDRFDENYGRLDSEIGVFEGAFGGDVIGWLDSRWPALLKAVYARKKISQFVDDEEVGTFLYDEGLRFGTEYPITEKSLAGRVKQGQPIVDHLVRKREQDRKRISHP